MREVEIAPSRLKLALMIRHRPPHEVLEDLQFVLEVMEEKAHSGLDAQAADVLRNGIVAQIANRSRRCKHRGSECNVSAAGRCGCSQRIAQAASRIGSLSLRWLGSAVGDRSGIVAIHGYNEVCRHN